jgi:NAD(P)-dependent dehydrogenase (short-subunit alcohol dehydrogenase family)
MTASPRIALVTGANKGIGLEIARQLASEGIIVYIGARDPARGEAAASSLAAEGLAVKSLVLDVTDEASIVAAAAVLAATHDHLDILVNNAGIVDPADAPPGSASLDAVRRLMDTNFIGALGVIQAVLPLLRRAPAARIVNLSSSLGSLAVNSDPTSPYYSARLIGYNASKAALNMLTIQLAAELAGTGITVNSVSPGYVKTDLTGFNGYMTPEDGARLPVQYALQDEAPVTGRFLEPGAETPW